MSEQPPPYLIANVVDDMVWAKVSIATDSGCAKAVTPKKIAGNDSTLKPTDRYLAKRKTMQRTVHQLITMVARP